MPSIGAITKTIRVNREDRAYLERIMTENNLSWSGAIHYLIGLKNENKGVPLREKTYTGGVPQENMPDLMDIAVEKDLAKMCELCGISTHDFFRDVDELFNDGKLEIENGKVKSRGEYNLRYFLETCHKANVRPQEMIDKFTRSLEKGV